jgi:thiamine biosynthesis protein ThiS
MTIVTNGKPRAVAEGATIGQLLDSLHLAAERVVIEHNGKALPRDCFAQTTLSSGDRLEIAQMVGGG